jgi:hypothetical protein
MYFASIYLIYINRSLIPAANNFKVPCSIIQPPQRLAFEQACDRIRDYLHTKAMRMAVAEYLKALSYGAEIKGIELVNL